MVIDCFSKSLFAVPLKRKTTEAIIEGFKKIFQTTDRRPERLQTDKGGEYDSKKFRKLMKDHDVIYNTTNNPDIKCSIAERLIRTIKTKIFKYLTYTNSFNYVDVLDDIVKSYNSGYHRTIKMAPDDVKDTNILQVYRNIKESQKKLLIHKKKRPKLKIGDYVRITKDKAIFAKGYTPNWTEEAFKVKSIVARNPIVYFLEDLEGEEIEGPFYEKKVQKINFDEGATRAIEKIIKQRGQGKKIQYLVKFRGWPTKFNSWVNSEAITTI